MRFHVVCVFAAVFTAMCATGLKAEAPPSLQSNLMNPLIGLTGMFKRGVNVRFWDFLFYSVFGLVVTSSVKAAGVLAVFTFLIVPSVCAVLLGKRGDAQLVWAWVIGIAGSAAAVWLSYARDLPTGASVVCVFGCLVTVISVVTHARFPNKKSDVL